MCETTGGAGGAEGRMEETKDPKVKETVVLLRNEWKLSEGKREPHANASTNTKYSHY